MENKFFPENEFPLQSCNIRGLLSNCNKSAVTNGHWRSLSAPSDETNSASWDLSPPPSEATQRWKQKPINKSSVERRVALHYRQAALEQDVAELQLRLDNERMVRDTLQWVSEPSSSSAVSPLHQQVNQEAEKLVTEIITLEGEVIRLEQYVLSLYRRVFDQIANKSSLVSDPNSGELGTSQQQPYAWGRLKGAFRFRKSPSPQHRRQVSVAPHATHSPSGMSCSNQPKTRHISLLGGKCKKHEDAESENKHCDRLLPSAPKESWKSGEEELRLMDVQMSPVQTLQQVLELHGGGNHAGVSLHSPYLMMDKLYRTPDKLSEELVRCMSAIYCKLAEPPIEQVGAPKTRLSSSSSSFASSTSVQECFGDSWSPQWRTDACETQSIDQLHLKGPSDNGGVCGSKVEVPWICVDKTRLAYATQALQNFRSMVEQLEKVDPVKIREEEKLAFWINIYNALMMHAYLAYGIPRHHLKRIALLQKAAYKIGAYTINANTIEQSILGCRSHHRSAQWLQMLLSPLTLFKATDEKRAFGLSKVEPLVCFALCCGGRSDPVVRTYSATNIKKELDLAKLDFLRASIEVNTDSKTILLPRMLEWYIREIGVAASDIIDWICHILPEKEDMILNCLNGRTQKDGAPCIEWLQHDFSFRYIFTGELVSGSPYYSK